MGPVVVVVLLLLLLLLFKTLAQDLLSKVNMESTVVLGEGSNPEESFIRETSTYVRHVLAGSVETFFGVGSLGSNPEESFIREVSTYV